MVLDAESNRELSRSAANRRCTDIPDFEQAKMQWVRRIVMSKLTLCSHFFGALFRVIGSTPVFRPSTSLRCIGVRNIDNDPHENEPILRISSSVDECK